MKNFLKKYKFYLLAILCLLVFVILFYLNKSRFEKAVMNNYNNLSFECDQSCIIGGEDVEVKDSKVYYNSVLVKEADPKTFKKIHKFYAVDKNNVYSRNYNSPHDDGYNRNQKYGYFMEKIKNADPKTFEVIDNWHSKDKNNVYILNSKINIIKNADPESFEILNSGKGFTKDKNNIYAGTKILKNADLETFEVIDDCYDDFWYAKDKENCYDYNKIVDMLECEKVEKFKKGTKECEN